MGNNKRDRAKKAEHGAPVLLAGDSVGAIMTMQQVHPKAAAVDRSSSSSTGNKNIYNENFDHTQDDKTAGQFVKWGSDNLFPKRVKDAIVKNTIAPRCLKIKVHAHYGLGLIYGEKSYDDNGKETFLPKKDEAVDQFMRRNRIGNFLGEQIVDYEWWYRCASIMTLTREPNFDKCKVEYIQHLDAFKYRFAPADDNGRIPYATINPDFENYDAKKDQKLPVITPDMNLEDIKERLGKKERKFVYYDYFPMPGMDYYPLMYWYGILSGWLQVANEIPILKKRLMRNQIIVKYHIQIPYGYWEKLAQQRNITDPEAKLKMIQDELALTEEWLKDKENTNGVLFTGFDDMKDGGEKQGWQINLIQEDLKDNTYLTDSQAANSEIAFAIGVDPTLFGHGVPGGKSMGGSGSDKRQAFNIHTALLALDRMKTTSALRLVGEINKWPDYHFTFKNIELQTLDVNPTGTKTTTA